MPIPNTGPLSIKDIVIELTGSAPQSEVSLESLNKGTFTSLNVNSISKPDIFSSHKISEWRGYDHNTSPGCDELELRYSNFSGFRACGSVAKTYYTDSSSIYTVTKIEFECGGGFASAGYYSDGTVFLYWNGSSVVGYGKCNSIKDPCFEVQLGYHPDDPTKACNMDNLNYYYIDNNDFGKVGYIGADCGFDANDGYYSNGSIWYLVKEGSIVSSGSCSGCYPQNVILSEKPCDRGESVTIYSDSESFGDSTSFYADSGCSEPLKEGYYGHVDSGLYILISKGEVSETGRCKK